MGRTPAGGMLCGIGHAPGGIMPPGGVAPRFAPNVAACISMPPGGGGRACMGGCIGGCIGGCNPGCIPGCLGGCIPGCIPGCIGG